MADHMVASDHVTLLIHAQATVSITVIGETNIQTLFHHKLLQTFNVGGIGIAIDIQTIWLCIDDVGVSTQRIENRLRDVSSTTVGAVQTHLDALEGVDAQRDQIAHVAVATGHIVHSAADVFPMGKGQFRPVFIEYMEFAVNVILD